MTPVSNTMRVFITAGFILITIAAVGLKWWQYQVNPWTRNGQVRAQVIQITPRVSGTIVELPIVDNQFVKAGDLLFQIDPRTYESTLHGMESLLAETEDEIEALTAQVEATANTIKRYDAAIKRAEQKLKGKAARVEDYRAQVKRYEELVQTGAASEERRDRAVADFIDSEAVLGGARAELLAAEAIKLQAEADLARDIANRGAEGKANARRRTAKARVHSAELQLEFTTVRAPVDGYVTHLDLRPGDHAAANHAALARATPTRRSRAASRAGAGASSSPTAAPRSSCCRRSRRPSNGSACPSACPFGSSSTSCRRASSWWSARGPRSWSGPGRPEPRVKHQSPRRRRRCNDCGTKITFRGRSRPGRRRCRYASLERTCLSIGREGKVLSV